MFKSKKRFSIESLEPRQLMAADPIFFMQPAETMLAGSVAANTSAYYGYQDVGKFPTEAHLPTKAELDAEMGLPLLDSLPGARATLYLDFTGNLEASWWQTVRGVKEKYENVATPAFDTDGNATRFSTDEQKMIRDIWAAVAEDFAPFNINVSTHYYGKFDNGQALKVAIGGDDDDWLIRPETKNPTGTSELGSFYNSAPNTVFVFTENFSNTSAERWKIATTISHEAGHAFGLRHRSEWGADGKVVEQYAMGTDTWTPIMGSNTVIDRTTWSKGTTEAGPKTMQDEMAIIAGPSNGFGYRADDHGGSFNTATPLTTPTTILDPMLGKGIISKTTDTDMFRFQTVGDSIRISVKGVAESANLVPRIKLWAADGRLVATAAATSYINAFNGTEAVITAKVAPGTYFVEVASLGDYGDVGQFTVAVTQSLANSPTKGTLGLPVTTNFASSPKIPAGTLTKTAAVQSTTLYGTDGASLSPSSPAATPTTKSSLTTQTAKANATPSPVGQTALESAFAQLGASLTSRRTA